MTGEMGAQALTRELGHGLATLPGRDFYGSGEIGFDLQPEQSVSSERTGHDVATPRSLRSDNDGSYTTTRQVSDDAD
jgi:hypothetical protein